MSQKPDFAFPRDVEASSRKQLEDALKSNDPQKALRAFMNLSIAESLISEENLPEIISQLDSLALQFESPYNALAYLLEAQIYYDIYLYDRWTYDSRTVDESMADSNPKFWDANLFRTKIMALTDRALEARKETSAISLRDFKLLVSVEGIKNCTGYTLYDFIVYRTIDLRKHFEDENVIPFFPSINSSSTPSCRELIDQLIDLHYKTGGAPLLTAIIEKSKLLDEPDGYNFLWKKVEELKALPVSCELLYYIYSECHIVSDGEKDWRKRIYLLAKELDAKFYDNPESKYTHALIKKLENEEIEIEYPSVVETTKDFTATVKSTNARSFHVLLLDVPALIEDRTEVPIFKRLAKVIDAKEVRFADTIPFSSSQDVIFRASAPGRYMIVASSTPSLKGLLTKSDYIYPRYIQASDIDIFCLNDSYPTLSRKEKATQIGDGYFVVNSSDSSPAEGAKVVFEKKERSGISKILNTNKKTLFTDSCGFVASPFSFSSGTIVATFKDSNAESNFYFSGKSGPDLEKKEVKIFTDRQIYRPGDTVNFIGVVLRHTSSEASLCPGDTVRVTLRDANRQEIATESFVSDPSGRIFGNFTLPTDGLLGQWALVSDQCRYSVTVAEYKTPSFLITLEKTEGEEGYADFKGVVRTYSGMPITNTKVDFKVEFNPFRFFYYSSSRKSKSYASSVETDSNGEFKISLPLSGLDIKEYIGLFTIKAFATDEAGETISSDTVPFWLTESYTISANVDSMTLVEGDSISYQVSVKSEAGLPAVKTVEYSVCNAKGETVSSGEFESPLFTISAKDLPSGEYTFRFNIKNDSSLPRQEYKTVIYRKSDAKPPVETALWIPETDIVAPVGADFVEVEFGSSFPGQHVLCVISSSDGHSSFRWLTADAKNTSVSIPAPGQHTRTFVTFVTCHNHVATTGKVTIIPEEQTFKAELVTESFRSSLSPGEEEKWRFSFRYNGVPTQGYAYALLYDKALDALADLRWYPYLFSPSYRDFININVPYYYQSHWRADLPSFNSYLPISIPEFDFETYGHGFTGIFRNIYYGSRKLYKSVPQASNASADFDACLAFDDSIAEESSLTTRMESAEVAGGILESEDLESEEPKEYREIEMPVAFFRPDLTTDAGGNIDIDFVVPNFNTTWKFIMGAYDRQLDCASTRLEAVAAKEVMVKMLPPRFLRTADEATITATVYNNSEKSQKIWSEFEIFDPVSGEVLKRIKTDAEALEPSRSRTVSIQFTCPDAINALGLRVYAKSGKHSDGEQTVIPVLPSSQPVIESDPFYLQPGQKDFTISLPATDLGGLTTFKYCDNPVWSVVTALPPLLTPLSSNLCSLVYTLYANSVGMGLLDKYPNIHEAIRLLTEQDTDNPLMKSNLETDEELKIVTLNNTPWVNDAKSETRRLSMLGSLLNTKEGSKKILDIWQSILQLQTNGGGMSWCKDMEPSLWATEVLLINLALLKGQGYDSYIPNVGVTAEMAMRFSDSEYRKRLNEVKSENDREGIYRSMLNYLYAMSFFPDHRPDRAVAEYYSRALLLYKSDWRKESIFSKATIAILLWRNGEKKTATEILESLRQFTSESPEKGVWFDNLDSGYGGASKLMTTARVLMAFNEIKPGDEIIDRMRQWLLIQRQAQDWQEGLFSIDVIDALLTCGSSWTGDYPMPQISIGGKMVKAGELENLTGECTLDINLKTLGKGKREISIRRESPTPAWGGVINQFIQPIKEIVADTIQELSIAKELWKIEVTANGETRVVKSDEFKVGDRVRVSLIIDCGRDMDYVALTDNRPACFEPADSLSGYALRDGLWCYEEMRNSATNLFFSFLPRGRHIVQYECYVTEEGRFANGIATLQCQYSPVLTAHSAGNVISVGR